MKKCFLALTIICLLTSCSITTLKYPQAVKMSSSSQVNTPWPSSITEKVPVACEEYFKDLETELPTVVQPFENCLKENNFAFKKFPIPNGTRDYYGYVGSNLPKPTVDPSCWMDPETQHGCLLYKVVKGKPSIISSQSFPTDDYSEGKGPLLQSTLVGVRSDGMLIFHSTSYEICFSHSYGTMDFTRERSQQWTPYITYFGASGCGDENGLWLYPQDSKKVVILLEPVDLPASMIRFTYVGKVISEIIGEIKIKNTELLSWDSGDFPNTKDLKAFALQTDHSKFHFVIEGKKYTLDVAAPTPKLLYK